MDKSYNKMLNMSIPKLIITLSIPAIISNLISNIYNLVDTYFVGTLGVSASGAIGIVFTLMAILQSIAFMFGQGAGTNISRRLAEQDEENASSFASIAFFFCIGIGIIFTTLGLIFLEPLMYLLGSTDTILKYAKTYGAMILISAPAIMASLAMNNIFRYEGKTYLGMIGLSLGGVLNIGMDALFINVFHLGVFGAGLATAISQYISFIVLVILLIKKSTCKLSFKYVLQKKEQILIVIKNGFPSFIRQSLNSVASGVLNNVAANYGDDCISAISICSRLQGFMFSIGLGIGQGFQPVASFNYQKKHFKRLKSSFYFTLFSSLMIFLIFTGISLMFSKQIIDLFIDSKSVVDIGSVTLSYLCVGLCFLPLSVTTNMLYQSTGQSLIASILASLRGGLCFLPYILILPLFMEIKGVQISNFLGDVTAALISFPFAIFYFRKIAKTKQINNE